MLLEKKVNIIIGNLVLFWYNKCNYCKGESVIKPIKISFESSKSVEVEKEIGRASCRERV